MPFHFVLPDHEVLAELVLAEEVNFLQLVVDLLILQPLIPGQELSFFVMVEGDSLATYCHVLFAISLSV